MSPGVIVQENFPDDRLYTYNALLEELTLIERHSRDGSSQICSCIPEKHLPLIAGLASEGYGFTEDPVEKRFMYDMMSQARVYKSQVSSGKIKRLEDFDRLRAWAREMRHRIEAKQWQGSWEELETAEGKLETLNPLQVELVSQIFGVDGTLSNMEEAHVEEMLKELASKHNMPVPKYKFIDGCNPLVPQAWMLSGDLKFTTPEGSMVVVRPDGDELIFCRGQTGPYHVAHEFCHHKQRRDEGKTDEVYATKCGLAEVGHSQYAVESVETLNTLQTQVTPSGGKMANPYLTKAKQVVPLAAGVLVGELVDEAGYIESTVGGYTGTYTQAVKGLVGLGISAFSLVKLKGAMQDFGLGVGLPIAVSGFRSQFMSGVSLGKTAALSNAAATAYATPRGLTPYATPTGLRAGHPTLEVTQLGSRPGVLAPSSLPASMSGKWNLGSR